MVVARVVLTGSSDDDGYCTGKVWCMSNVITFMTKGLYLKYERGKNMNTIKKILTITLTLMLVVSAVDSAFAITIVPYADDVFDTTKVQLASNGKVTLYCATYDVKKSIKVTSCWLEKKRNGAWDYSCSITPPSEEGINTIGFSATLNCMSFIGSGTYRFAATFDADGHSITRYSKGTDF